MPHSIQPNLPADSTPPSNVDAALHCSFERVLAVLGYSEPAFQHLTELRCDVESICRGQQQQIEAQNQELLRRAMTDALTGLPNRAVLLDRISQCIHRRRRDALRNFAVLVLDFDRFNIINDGLGHDVGDELLRSIAATLNSALRQTDTVSRTDVRTEPTTGRLGGDKFVILLEELRDERDAAMVAQRLLAAVSRPHSMNHHEITGTASIGIALSADTHATAEQALRDAETALHRAKAQGRNRIVLFDEKMHTQAMQRLELEHELRRAIEKQELFLQYQPIVDLLNGTLVGFEALVRWRHARLGVVPPDAFIPIAEETGLIVPIGRWVLHEAGRQLADWKRSFPGQSFWVSVNLSKKQLATNNLVCEFMHTLKDVGVAPADVRLEITESLVVEDAAAGLATLRALKDHGFSLLMDDFGTGLSSLSLLHQFPLSGLKIDRAFIRNVNDRREYAAVISAIVILAHNLGLSVTAEGVETAEQAQMLQALDCDTAQGYYFARPMNVEQATASITAPAHRLAA